MEAFWIAIGVVVVLAVFFLLTRVGREKRRQAAAGLRKEAIDREERARQAETAAEQQRSAAETRRKRADKIDPDSGSGGLRKPRILERISNRS